MGSIMAGRGCVWLCTRNATILRVSAMARYTAYGTDRVIVIQPVSEYSLGLHFSQLRRQPRGHATASARTSSDCGTVMPSAFAVLRLITSSNFVACSTGRSPGFGPLSR